MIQKHEEGKQGREIMEPLMMLKIRTGTQTGDESKLARGIA